MVARKAKYSHPDLKTFSFVDIQYRNETKMVLGIKSPERLYFYFAILSVDICFIGYGNARCGS